MTLYLYVGHKTNVTELDPFCLTVGSKINGILTDTVFRGWKLTLALILVKLDIEQNENWGDETECYYTLLAHYTAKQLIPYCQN